MVAAVATTVMSSMVGEREGEKQGEEMMVVEKSVEDVIHERPSGSGGWESSVLSKPSANGSTPAVQGGMRRSSLLQRASGRE
eukprot:scaffold14736_cov207-Ochromonas_danica.AAC.1